MRAAVQSVYGPPEVLQVQDVPTPVPAPGEVLIRIHATVVTPSEIAFRKGDPFMARLFSGLLRPRIATPGDNLAGFVEAVGAGVSRFKPGDRVFGSTGATLGAYAEFKCLPEQAALAIVPDGMAFGEAAGLADGGLTALPFLRDVAGLNAGQRILINGASGSVGMAAMQFAKHMGAVVTGVCSARNTEVVKSLGADFAIDYGTQDFARLGETYDVIFDAVGKSSFSRARSALTPDGIYMSAVPSLGMLPAMLRKHGQRARFAATGLRPTEAKSPDLKFLVSLWSSGAFRVPVDRPYSLEQVVDAHRYVEAGHKVGSVVLSIVPAQASISSTDS